MGGKIGKSLPLIVFGALCVFAGFLLFLLPETAGRELPGTIQDGIDFGKSVFFYNFSFYFYNYVSSSDFSLLYCDLKVFSKKTLP